MADEHNETVEHLVADVVFQRVLANNEQLTRALMTVAKPAGQFGDATNILNHDHYLLIHSMTKLSSWLRQR